jgi:hypothetical protein
MNCVPLIMEQITRTRIMRCGSYEFAIEPLNDTAWDEFLVVERKRFDEMNGAYGQEPFAPNKQARQAELVLGRLFYCTIRDGNRVLVGYCFLLRWQCRHSGQTRAGDEVLFLDKPHRVGRLFLRFMTYLEDLARDAGATRAIIQPWVNGQHVRLAQHLGYQVTAYVMEKPL